MDQFIQVLASVRQRIERFRESKSLNEENTKATLVEPVIRALGWSPEDIDEVHREYKPKKQDKPVDYALLILRSPRLFIEVKALGKDLDDRRWANQIMGYAAVAGVEWVVLTDGDEYRLYNAHAAVAVDRKLFRTVRISDDGSTPEETLRLLSRKEMEEKRIDTLWNAYFIDRQVRGELVKLFDAEPDPFLVRHLRKRLETLTPKEIRTSLQRAEVHIDFPVMPNISVEPPAETNEPPASKRSQNDGQPNSRKRPTRSSVSLADVVNRRVVEFPLALHCDYKGNRLTARIEADGSVVWNGETFTSLSTAAGYARKSIVGAPDGRPYPQTNGWAFWKFVDEDGEEREIHVLRQRLQGVRE